MYCFNIKPHKKTCWPCFWGHTKFIYPTKFILIWTLCAQTWFTCVSVSMRDVATSKRFGLDRYLFSLNWCSSSSSCWLVKAVLGLLHFPSKLDCAWAAGGKQHQYHTFIQFFRSNLGLITLITRKLPALGCYVVISHIPNPPVYTTRSSTYEYVHRETICHRVLTKSVKTSGNKKAVSGEQTACGLWVSHPSATFPLSIIWQF